MHIDFENMNDESRELYKFMWGQEDNIPGGAGNLCQTYDKHHKKESKNSYSFFTGIKHKDLVGKDENINEANKKKVREYLLNIFNVENKAIFREKFDEVCSGSGGEVAKITCLHSSSLCGLLFFYNVKENKLKLTLNGREILFDDVYFEFKNKVTKNGNPSNIDVVLISSTQHVILFLESKFSEYLNTLNKYTDLSPQYLDEYAEIYNDSLLNSVGLQIIKENNKPKIFERTKKGKKVSYNGFMTIDKKEETYLEGIKQMISHYIGLKHFVTEPRMEKGLKYNNQKVILGEIMFDFSFEEAQTKFNNYSKMYSKLANKLNEMDKRIFVLEEPLRYSMFKNNNYKLNPIVKKFYFGNSK